MVLYKALLQTWTDIINLLTMVILAAVYAFQFNLILNAKFRKIYNDCCDSPPTSNLPESSSALFGHFEMMTSNGL